MKPNSKCCLFLVVLCVFVLNLFGCSEELPTPATGGGDEITNLNYLPDSDGDGWTPLSDAELSEFGVLKSPLKKGDCDDTDKNVYPGADEIVDGKDSDCDGALGSNECANDANCDDANACTTADICKAGVCAGTALVCDDQNLCTDDSCDLATGCVFASVVCYDDNICTDDSCNPATGCVYTANAGFCDDGNICTTGDFCKDGTCNAGGPLNCNDSNICNGTETCDPATGCVLGNQPLVCNDFNVCTTDSCDPLAGCQYVAVVCDDLNLCTTDTCDQVTGCAYTQKDCDDGKECTADLCDPATGECKNLIDDGALCVDDGDKCTTDLCSATGECVHGAIICNDNNACNGVETCVPATGCVAGAPLACDDQNPCTNDSCDALAGCQHVNNSDQCSDGTVCTNGDACANGVCVPGPVLNCNDSDACTSDACDPITGCSNAAVPDCCYNDNMCLPAPPQLPSEGYLWGCSEETGLAGECTSCIDKDGDGVCASVESLCDDGWDGDADLLIDCLDDDCDDATCDDGDKCTTNDACTAGDCVAGPATNCNDANACTTDTCNSATGCIHVATSCNDNDACTIDSCVPATGCKYVDDPECCKVNGECAAGELCLNNVCETASGPAFDGDGDCYCAVAVVECSVSINQSCAVLKPGDCDNDPTGSNEWSVCETAVGQTYLVTTADTCLTGGVYQFATDGSILNNPAMNDYVGDGFDNDCDGDVDEGGADPCEWTPLGSGKFKVTCTWL